VVLFKALIYRLKQEKKWMRVSLSHHNKGNGGVKIPKSTLPLFKRMRRSLSCFQLCKGFWRPDYRGKSM